MNIEELKKEYNHNLKRIYNGYKYCEEHIEEIDRWLPELEKINYILGRLLEEIGQASTKEILEGFEVG